MRTVIFPFVVVFLSGLCAEPSFSAEPAEWRSSLQRSNELYDSGSFCEAMELYAELIAQGLENSSVYYNMGNACYKCGELGEAVLFYEKAMRLSPRDADIRANLDFVRSRVTGDEQGKDLFSILFNRVFFFLSLNELYLVESVIVFLLALSGIFFLGSPAGRRRQVMQAVALITGILLLLSILFLAVRTIDNRNKEAIILSEQVDAMSGPGDGNIKVLSLPEGMKVWVDEERNGWYLIHISTGRGGWVQRADLGLI